MPPVLPWGLLGASDARLTTGQTLGQRVLAEGGQGLALELADAFQRHPELLPELGERPGGVGLEAETPPHEVPLPVRQALQRIFPADFGARRAMSEGYSNSYAIM